MKRIGTTIVLYVACLAIVLLASEAASGPWFQDVTKAAGISARHGNRVFDNPYAKIMAGYTALGASASVADFDGDGYDDVFVTDSKLGGKNHLYHNNRDFTFTDVAEKAGVANGNDEGNATADSLWFDFNNDGKPDLLVVRFGHNQLFQNMGNGKFKDVTKGSGSKVTRMPLPPSRSITIAMENSTFSSVPISSPSIFSSPIRRVSSRRVSRPPIMAAG